MRRFLLTLILPLALAACGQAEAPAAPPDGPAAAQAPAPPAPAAIPAVFHGRWAADAAACAVTGHESRLIVGPGELAFHESIGRVRDVAATGDRTADVSADFEGEGETWSRALRLSLSADDQTLTIQYPDGEAFSRHRCIPA